jgi:hypothetical protein
VNRKVTSKGRKHGRAAVVLRIPDYAVIHDWPDPPMVTTVALRRVEQAETIAEVRAIVHQFLRPRASDA